MVEFMMMIGLPASGKSTYAKVLADGRNAQLVSSDSIREELYGNVYDLIHNEEVFNVMRIRTKEFLSNGISVVYDATNMSYKKRMSLLSELSKIPCLKTAFLMATPYDECIRRNSNRERVVPEHVLEKMRMNFHIPYYYEGWDKIALMPSCISQTPSFDFIIKSCNFNQDNSHHTASLGEHCLLTSLQLKDSSLNIIEAARLHDVGKLYTKKFFDDSKDPMEAHYYNHNNVGAYECLFYDLENPLEVAVLIQWHMMPYVWEREDNKKLETKYRELWGDELFNNIMKLHNADKISH